MPAARKGATSTRSSKLRLATVPRVQLSMSESENGLGARFISSAIIAPAKLDSPTPTRIRVTTEPIRVAATVSRAVAASAPAMAANGMTSAPAPTRP